MKNKIVKFLPFILSAIGTIFTFATTFLLSHTLGPQIYGQIQYWLGIINTTYIIIVFGLPNFLIKNLHLQEDKRKFFSKCMMLFLILNIVAIPIFYRIATSVLTQLNGDPKLIVLIYVASFLFAISLIVAYYYMAIGKKSLSFIIETVLPKTLILVAVLIFIVLDRKSQLFDVYLFIFILAYLLTIIVPLIKNFRIASPKFSKADYVSISVFFIIAVTSGINAQVSKILLGEAGEGNYTAVAVFSIANQVINVVNAFTIIIISMARPRFAKLCSDGNNEEIARFYKIVLRLTSRLVIPFIVGVVLQQSTVLSLFGEGYNGFPLIMVFLGIYLILSTITGPAGTLLAMGGHEKAELGVDIVNFLVFIILGFSLVKVFYFGVPLALAASYLASYLIRVIIIRKIYHFTFMDLKTLLEIIALASISFGAFFLINQFVSNVVLKIVLDVIAGGAIIVLSNSFSYMRRDLKEFLSSK